MSPRLEGKVCVITGAGGGMGADAAVRFTEEGAQVVAADIDGAAAEQVAGQIGGLAVQVDVSDEASVEAMYTAAAERFGGIDVLYNNAGVSPADDASILETGLDAWERVQAVNTRGVYLCCKHGIPHLLERGGGSVINVASFVALVGAATSQISYTASKGARGRSRPRSCCGSGARRPAQPSGGSSTCRWDGWRNRARSSMQPSSSRATSRAT